MEIKQVFFYPFKNQSNADTPMVDTAEQVYISSLALLKVRKLVDK